MNNWLHGRRYEYSISVGMIFKKMYCCKCGEKLKKEFITVDYDPESKANKEAWFTGTSIRFIYRPHPDGTEYKECFYICKKCGYALSYNDQKIISEYQKETGKKILNEKQRAFINHIFENDFK